jgi:signal transduction histidine kinase
LDLDEELEALARASSGLRGAIYDLRHESEGSFVGSVGSLVELHRNSMPEQAVTLTVEETVRGTMIPSGVGVELLRVLREVLTNARRHSGAKNLEVKLRAERQALIIEVADDGRGFDPAAAGGGVGLVGMRERVEGLGGRIEVRSQHGKGTRVEVMVPGGPGRSCPGPP